MEKMIIVVGDDFEQFADNNSVVTLKDFKRSTDIDTDNVSVVPGLGLSSSEFRKISNTSAIEVLQPAANTHKSELDNVMVTQPAKTSSHGYEVGFILNNARDRLLDHITGMHVSGMVLIEAARQASIACTEIEFKLTGPDSNSSFMWTGMSANFTKFAFPVPTRIQLVLKTLSTESANRKSLESHVSFFQGKTEIADM